MLDQDTFLENIVHAADEIMMDIGLIAHKIANESLNKIETSDIQ